MTRFLSYLILLVVFLVNNTFAQEYEFKYQRSLEGIIDTWHQIDLPEDAYSKLNADFSDVRIIGIMANGDTIETPYILKVQSDLLETKEIDFKLINQVSNKNGYYYTFELPEKQTLNSIELSFDKSNFDWLVTLEGSQNQQEWFTVVDKSRIVGIENKNTSYQYTTLNFSNISYKYLRLKVSTSKNPKFSKAVMQERKVIKGVYNKPNISSFKVLNNDDTNKTEILVSLSNSIPISFLDLQITDSIDYYRSIRVEYAIDSIKNATGWHYLYKNLFNGTLSSVNKGHNFSNRVLNHLRIIIDNNDNEPLNYKKLKLYGNTHSLTARFTKLADYYLVYGNTNAYVPNYDITRFQENIPVQNQLLKVGDEVKINELIIDEEDPLFKDDIWLWSIMILVIFILGWFSYKMLKT